MTLKQLLWADFTLGFTTGIVGLLFPNFWKSFFTIPIVVIVLISLVTLLYSFFALFLATQRFPNIKLTRSLIIANWIWSLISIILIYLYFLNASTFGKLFLLLQIIVVGGLAYLEGRALSQLEESKKAQVSA